MLITCGLCALLCNLLILPPTRTNKAPAFALLNLCRWTLREGECVPPVWDAGMHKRGWASVQCCFRSPIMIHGIG